MTACRRNSLIALMYPLICLGCSSTGSLMRSSNIETSVPMHMVTDDSNNVLPEVDVIIDGHAHRFLLDTGAVGSGVKTNELTSQYPSLGEHEGRGVSGRGVKCDIIQPKVIEFGGKEFHNPRLERCHHSSTLGLDILGQRIFQVDFSTEMLGFLAQLPSGPAQPSSRLRRLSSGHVAIPAQLNRLTTEAIFDTGAGITVIDARFVREHPEHFEMARSEQGTDAHGHTIQSDIYTASVLRSGGIEFHEVEMAAFEFGDHLRSKMEGVPIILGTNVISKAKWSFDLGSGIWVVEESVRH